MFYEPVVKVPRHVTQKKTSPTSKRFLFMKFAIFFFLCLPQLSMNDLYTLYFIAADHMNIKSVLTCTGSELRALS